MQWREQWKFSLKLRGHSERKRKRKKIEESRK